MRNSSIRRFRPGIETLEAREAPAFLAPIASSGGGDSIAIGDINEDGRDDAVVLRGNKVDLFLSDGDGTFRPLTTLTGAKGPLQHVSLADANFDGNLDVIAGGLKASGWTTGWGRMRTYTAYSNIWRGNGDGTFGPVTTTTFATFGPGTVHNPVSAIGDFNSDGITDLARVNTSNDSIDVLLGNADGTYQVPRTFAAGPSPGSIAVGDFNGDGRTDIVVVNNLGSNQPTLSVLLNDGNW